MTYNQGNNTYLPPSPVAPMSLLISSITNSNPMVVTVSTPNQYIAGQVVVFTVPFTYGMYQANELTAQIIAIDSTNLIFTVNIDSSNFDPFTPPPAGIYYERPASIASAGCRNVFNVTTLPFHAINGSTGN